MPINIIDQQRRLAEIGRIRLGRQVESRSGKKHPTALDTFRLTSTDRERINEAAHLYGGTVTKWDSPSGLPQWEVITEADRLPVVVPPTAMAFSQNFELWSAGGCQRRCDGVTESISEQPCLCDPDTRQCDIHTRLSVMLRDLVGLGVWRVDTTGYYAAVELQGAVEVIALAAGRGQMLPATLRLDQRTIKRADEPKKQFVVPVLDIEVSPAQLLMGTVAIEAPKQPALTPVPPSGKPASIAEQVGAEVKPNRRTTPVRATGITPRTAAQARARTTVMDTPPAGEQTQEPPRMVTNGQLTKLGILLTNRGFNNSQEGRAARLDFCSAAIQRRISTSKALTFDEASGLINMLEQDERIARAHAAKQTEDAQQTGLQDEAAGTESDEPPPADPQDDAQPDAQPGDNRENEPPPTESGEPDAESSDGQMTLA